MAEQRWTRGLDPGPAGPAYVYRARAWKVTDGDTFVAMIDVGFEDFARRKIRLHGINAPEVHGETKVAGEAAADALIGFLTTGGGAVHWKRGMAIPEEEAWPLLLRTYRDDRSFERWVADVWVVLASDDRRSVAREMVVSGHAVEAFL